MGYFVWQTDIFELMTKNRSSEISASKISFFKLPGEIDIGRKFAWEISGFFTQNHDPQISNQIDAAVYAYGVLANTHAS